MASGMQPGRVKPIASVGAFLRYAKFDAWLSQQNSSELHGITRDTLIQLSSQLYVAFEDRLKSSPTPSFGRGDGELPRSAACVNTVLRSMTEGDLELPLALISRGCAMKAGAMEILIPAIQQHLKPIWEELQKSIERSVEDGATSEGPQNTSEGPQKQESTEAETGKKREEEATPAHSERSTTHEPEAEKGGVPDGHSAEVSKSEVDLKTASLVHTKQKDAEETITDAKTADADTSSLPTKKKTDAPTKSNNKRVSCPDEGMPSANDNTSSKTARVGTRSRRSMDTSASETAASIGANTAAVGTRSRRSVDTSASETAASIGTRAVKKRAIATNDDAAVETRKRRSSARLQNKETDKTGAASPAGKVVGADNSAEASSKKRRLSERRQEKSDDTTTNSSEEPSETTLREERDTSDNVQIESISEGDCRSTESRREEGGGKSPTTLNQEVLLESLGSPLQKKEAKVGSALESTCAPPAEEPSPDMALKEPPTVPAITTTTAQKSDDSDSTDRTPTRRTREETTTNAAAEEHLPPIDQQMDQLLSLLSSRRRGRVDNDRVEEAVEYFVKSLNHGKEPSPRKKDTTSKLHQQTSEAICYDDTNYDEDEEMEDQKSSASESGRPASKPSAKDESTQLEWTGGHVTVEKLKEQEEQLDSKKGDLWKRWESLDDVPMGKTGARMMVTFGDGQNPDSQAVAVALMGARECLQNAIRDARAWRRKEQQDYKRAQGAVNQHLKKIPNRQLVSKGEDQCVDAEMMFRAFEKYDKLSQSPQCGFDIPQLEQLFPEEMNAYKRWTSMHDAYTSSKDSKDVEAIEDSKEAPTDGDANETGVSEVQSQKGVDGGHLHERLAHFDARTERMMNDWYLTFSEVRQGSFISRGGASNEDRQWEESRRAHRTKGRISSSTNSTWESLPASFVPFLHWIGFDPNSALRPPNEATAQALAFLAYDFMGRIVEKAIFLRFICRRNEARKAGKLDDDDDDGLEMREGEQLTAADIVRALNDSSVVSKPLYRSRKPDDGPQDRAAQLYFGPGFERRLEMELEEFVRSRDEQSAESDEQMAFLREEAALFSSLREPPKLLKGVLDVLGDDLASSQRETVQNRREKASQSVAGSDSAGEVKDGETPKRKRGRPKGSKNKRPPTRKSSRLSLE